MQTIIELINNYGYIILFLALVLELIALPLPGELMMTYCGFLVYEAKLNWIISILVATAGVICGITISYAAGTKLGAEFFRKYGSYINLTPERIEKTSTWFDLYGTKLLILAYFIPGVRHVTGYFSGITELSFKKFASNAYAGALIWTTTFISLGNFLGTNWYRIHNYLKEFTVVIILVLALILTIGYICKKYKPSLIESAFRTILSFNFSGKLQIVIVSIIAFLLGFYAYYNFL